MTQPQPPRRHIPVPQLQELRDYFHDTTRFQINHSGRRSYKTELIKRRTIAIALDPWNPKWGALGATTAEPRYCFAGPIWQQTKKIYWRDVVSMIPDWAFHPNKDRGVSHSDLVIRLRNGVEIFLAGMDKPERIEGPPLSGIVMDEYANMKKQTWGEHVRPALSDIGGWAAFIGVPEGRNHYYDAVEKAEQHIVQRRADDLPPNWSIHHWHSKIVLSGEELDAALGEMDDLTFAQEFGGEFVYFHGRVYYPFDKGIHAAHRLAYNPDRPLDFMFDFNIAPGVAAVGQEQELPGQFVEKTVHGVLYTEPVVGTGIIGEVFIPRNSNTKLVCARLHQDWGDHRGPIYCYGDSTGGAGGSAKVEGSDWDIIRREMRRLFGDRVHYRVKSQNPRERGRVNAVNSRLMASSGVVRMMVDPVKAPHVVKDFEGVRLVEGGSGEIDKKSDSDLTHLTDGIGYYIDYCFPIRDRVDVVEQVVI